MTNQEVAKLLDLTPEMISYVRRGERRLGAEKALKAACLFGIPVEMFLKMDTEAICRAFDGNPVDECL